MAIIKINVRASEIITAHVNALLNLRLRFSLTSIILGDQCLWEQKFTSTGSNGQVGGL